MGEEMAEKRIEQEAVPASEIYRDAMRRGNEALRRMSTGLRAAAFVGLIAGITTASQPREGTIETSSIQPTRDQGTPLEVGQKPADNLDIVATSDEAPGYIRKVPPQEVPAQPEATVSFNSNYTVRPGDTLSEIAQRFGTTQEEIIALNKIEDPNLLSIGESITIPEVSVEKTVEFLKDLQNKVDEIYELKQSKSCTATPNGVKCDSDKWVATSVLGEIFKRVESNLASLQTFIESGKQDSLEARKTSKEIMEYWNTAPGGKEEVKAPEIIIVNPAEAKNVELMVEYVRELLSVLPNSGRVVEKILIEPEGTWPDWLKKDSWTHVEEAFTFKDRGADIHIYGYQKDSFLGENVDEIYKKGAFQGHLLHEFSHGSSLYSQGYNLQFFTPSEVINLVFEDARLWNQEYKTYQGTPPSINEEEWNAWLAPNFMRWGEHVAFRTPELYQARLRFVNLWLSKQLGENIDVIKLGEQLGLR